MIGGLNAAVIVPADDVNIHGEKIIEILEDFAFKANEKNIHITLISERAIVENPSSYIEFFKLRPKVA